MNRRLAALVLASGCATPLRSAELPPLVFTAAEPAAAAPLADDHFVRDRTFGLSETHLKEILAAPVFLEEGARLGVVPVAQRYAPDEAVPTVAVPAELVAALEESGMFEMASEISTEWPTDRGLPGLRELAARYRSEYLLVYRHRFVQELSHNAWAAGYATVLGALFFPGQELEANGVLEATLYDVKTGTLLFTVHERVAGSDSAAPTTQARRRAELEKKMLKEAAPRLAERVVSKCRRLWAARPGAPAARAATFGGSGL